MFDKNSFTEDIKRIHFRGIGGVSMSGVAATLRSIGYVVTGSDDNESIHTKKLIEDGIPVVIGLDLDNLKNADLLIYTNSISLDDEEILLAKELNIPIIERAEALGLITKNYENPIGIAGTNGKTTTTAMVSSIFLEAKKDPNIQIGAILKSINSNYQIGESEILIYEACEYRESFLKFKHETAVILNIDYDHLDYFKDFEHIKEAFFKFAKNTENNGNIILNWEDKTTTEMMEKLKIYSNKENKNFKILTFGFSDNADVYAKDIYYKDNKLNYKLYFNNEFIGDISLNVFGDFNVLNSLAAITVALVYRIDIDDIKLGFEKYSSANRRFEFRGQINGADVYDDYAHNPTKVKELYSAAKALNKETWIVFEPHTYSRTKELFDEFVDALKNYDNIILTKIFPAREKNIFNIESDSLVKVLNEKHNKKALYIEEYEDIIKYLKENVKEDDLVLFVGAGTINNLFDYA